MNCREIQADLSAYIDRELSSEASEGVRSHLVACAQCRAEHERMSGAWLALEAWEDVKPPEKLRKKILEAARPQRRGVSLRAAASIAAVLLLVLGIAFFYAGQRSRNAQDLARNQSPVQAGVGDISEDEIIANLLLLEDDDFFEELDELVKIDDLPFVDEPSKGTKDLERSSLDVILT